MSAPWLRSVFGADSAVGALLGAVIPNWQLFWMSSALSSGALIPVRYLLAVTAYVILYCAVCMLWAAAFFQNTEPAKDSRI